MKLNLKELDMKKIIRVAVENHSEEELIRRTLRDSGFRVVKGFNSIIVPVEGTIKKGNNKYRKLLLALLALQSIGFKDRARIISLGI